MKGINRPAPLTPSLLPRNCGVSGGEADISWTISSCKFCTQNLASFCPTTRNFSQTKQYLHIRIDRSILKSYFFHSSWLNNLTP